jgi:hypothetical protein
MSVSVTQNTGSTEPVVPSSKAEATQQATQMLTADPTSLTIAEMLDIDLSSAPTAEAASALVVDAVQALVVALHDCSTELQQYQSQDEEQEIDPTTGQPIEQPELDENGEPIEQAPEDDTQEQETPTPGTAKPGASPFGKKPSPAAPDDKKKKPPFGKGVKASTDDDFGISPKVLKMAVGARITEINALARDGHILPAAIAPLTKRWANEKQVSLSLSSDDDDTDDGFTSVIESLKLSHVAEFNEKTMEQDRFRTLDQAGISLKDLANNNVMIADAEERLKREQRN